MQKLSIRARCLASELDIRNTFKNITMGEETLLLLLSPVFPATFSSINQARRSVSIFCDNSIENAEEVVSGHLHNHRVEEMLRKFSKENDSLVRQTSTDFDGLSADEGELMIILSTSKPISIKNFCGKARGGLISGVISQAFLRTIMGMLHIQCESDDLYGVFKSVCKLHKQPCR